MSAILLTVGFLLCLAACLLFPEALSRATAETLELFARSVLPGLFPGLLLSRYFLPRLTFSGDGLPGRVFTCLAGAPPEVFGAWCAARFSGNPAGAHALAEVLRRGDIAPDQADACALLCSGTGPVFLAVGAASGMLGCPEAGWRLLLAHELGLILAFRLLYRRVKSSSTRSVPTPAEPPTLGACLASVLYTLGQVAGMLLIFACAREVLASTGLPEALARRLPERTTLFLGVALQGLAEMTSGCKAASALPLSLSLPAVAGITGFGGLCVAAQSFAAWEGLPVSRTRFLFGKALHGLAACGICFALNGLFPLGLSAFSGGKNVAFSFVYVHEILPALLTVFLFKLWGRKR